MLVFFISFFTSLSPFLNGPVKPKRLRDQWKSTVEQYGMIV